MRKISQEQSLFSSEEYQATFKKNKKSKKEANVQVEVCAYLKSKYPDIIFTCDLASGMNLGRWIGGMNARLRSSRGLPDLFIAKPMDDKYIDKVSYNGLFIELKKDGVVVKLKNGQLPSDPHLKEQAEILARLKQLGYMAVFACGLEEAKSIIDDYLK